MKTPIIRRLSMLLSTTFLVAGNFAQSTDMLSSQQLTSLFSSEANIESTNLFADPVISSKTLSAFAGMFKGASDAHWYAVENKFLVKFSADGRESTALFNKKGDHLYTISYGFEKHLPAAVRKLVKINYFDYEITRAIEVNSLGKTAWIVKLEDANRMITVKVAGGEMEETENYRKSK
jgi:hypothetical protein